MALIVELYKSSFVGVRERDATVDGLSLVCLPLSAKITKLWSDKGARKVSTVSNKRTSVRKNNIKIQVDEVFATLVGSII